MHRTWYSSTRYSSARQDTTAAALLPPVQLILRYARENRAFMEYINHYEVLRIYCLLQQHAENCTGRLAGVQNRGREGKREREREKGSESLRVVVSCLSREETSPAVNNKIHPSSSLRHPCPPPPSLLRLVADNHTYT